MAPARHATTWERLCEAAIAYADADDADDGGSFMRARDRLRKAALAYSLDTSKGPEVRRRMVKRLVVASWRANQLSLWPRAMAR